MTTKINSSTKIQGKTIIQAEPIVYSETTSAYTVFFPNNRYPGGVGGQTWRIVERNGVANGKPTYGYGDEIIMWNSSLHRWEMNNAYQGTISYSPENVSYPWEVNKWYYGSSIFDRYVFVNKSDVSPIQTNPQQNVAGEASVTGFFFDGFGPGKTLNSVQVGWYANEHLGGSSVINALVTNVNLSNQTITIAAGNGMFQSGVSYRFSTVRM